MQSRSWILISALAATVPAFAHGDKHAAPAPASASASASASAAAPATSPATAAKTPMAEAEVRKVDKDAKKITLKHGEIKNLDMPAMTMVFVAKDPAMLDLVKAGDKVRFHAEKVGGSYTVTHIEMAK